MKGNTVGKNASNLTPMCSCGTGAWSQELHEAFSELLALQAKGTSGIFAEDRCALQGYIASTCHSTVPYYVLTFSMTDARTLLQGDSRTQPPAAIASNDSGGVIASIFQAHRIDEPGTNGMGAGAEKLGHCPRRPNATN